MKREPVRIRTAGLRDAPAIAHVMRASIRRLARGTCSPRQLAAWSSLPALYHAWALSRGGEEYVAADEGGRIVGYAARRGREVTAVFVLPSRVRRGLGTRLLAAVERRAARSGARSVFVRAAPGAVAFYEARGYRPAGRVRVPLPGGVHLRARRLAKRLAAAAP
jgi:GNAT superfamily N-acetyltransferase